MSAVGGWLYEARCKAQRLTGAARGLERDAARLADRVRNRRRKAKTRAGRVHLASRSLRKRHHPRIQILLAGEDRSAGRSARVLPGKRRAVARNRRRLRG